MSKKNSSCSRIVSIFATSWLRCRKSGTSSLLKHVCALIEALPPRTCTGSIEKRVTLFLLPESALRIGFECDLPEAFDGQPARTRAESNKLASHFLAERFDFLPEPSDNHVLFVELAKVARVLLPVLDVDLRVAREQEADLMSVEHAH